MRAIKRQFYFIMFIIAMLVSEVCLGEVPDESIYIETDFYDAHITSDVSAVQYDDISITGVLTGRTISCLCLAERHLPSGRNYRFLQNFKLPVSLFIFSGFLIFVAIFLTIEKNSTVILNYIHNKDGKK